MPVRLRDSGDSEVILSSYALDSDDEGSYFSLTDEHDRRIRVRHVPASATSWDTTRVGLWIFQNPYLNAENDVFEVYLNEGGDGRAGWLFPIRLLDSNDSNSIDRGNLKEYRSLAYRMLFEANCASMASYVPDRFYQMSELYGDVVILLLSNDVTQGIVDFTINRYLLSFYQSGYVLRDGAQLIEPKHSGALISGERRGRMRLNLRMARYDLNDDVFTQALVTDTLLQTREPAVRFILLYQVLEHLMSKAAHREFELLLAKYSSGELSKNDFREEIHEVTKERDILRRLFDGWNLDGQFRSAFADECEDLLAGHGVLKTRDLHNCIYDVRNLLTHRLRLVMGQRMQLERVVERFEWLLLQFLIEKGED